MTRLREGTSIFCMGDIVPDVIIPYGQAKQAQTALQQGQVVECNPKLRPGGAVANTTAVLGKLGAAPYFLGGTSSDEYGDYLCHYLQSCGVHTDYLFRQPEHSSLMLAVLDAVRRAQILRAVEAATVLFGSGAEEFAPLTGISDLHRAAASLATGKRIVVARDGAKPVHLFADGTSTVIPVPPVKVVNSVGGGDAFNAGFIAAYVGGRSAAEAVRWGNCCAGFAIGSDRPHDVPDASVVAQAVAAAE